MMLRGLNSTMVRWDTFVNMTNYLKKISIFAFAFMLLSACGVSSETDDAIAAVEFEPISEKEISDAQIEEATTVEENPDIIADLVAVPESQETITIAADTRTEAESIVDAMSLEEKIYQLFIVYPEQITGEECVTDAGDDFREGLNKYPVGGIVFFSQNIVTPGQTAEMLKEIQQYAMEIEEVPLFLCIDEEGGTVTRVAQNVSFNVDNKGDMINVSDEESAYDIGKYIGGYLCDIGFNVDFAPVADVLTNESNVVVKKRSFGGNSQRVTACANAYSKGLHDSSVLSTFKHFPGHGATAGDTHEGFAYTEKTYDELLESELIPFAGAEEQGVDFVMVSHISVPNITGNNIPCSLSYQMVTSVLKDDMGYEGIVITDAMGMGAISKSYGDVQAVLMAVKAGNDMVLGPKDLKASYEAIKKAVENGDISEDMIDDSVLKIIEKKIILRDSQNN